MRTSRASSAIESEGSRFSRSRSRARHNRRKPSCLSSTSGSSVLPVDTWNLDSMAPAGDQRRDVIDDPVFHPPPHAPQLLDVLEWIAVDEAQVGQHAGRDA